MDHAGERVARLARIAHQNPTAGPAQDERRLQTGWPATSHYDIEHDRTSKGTGRTTRHPYFDISALKYNYVKMWRANPTVRDLHPAAAALNGNRSPHDPIVASTILATRATYPRATFRQG
jgi:hypothetical protein